MIKVRRKIAYISLTFMMLFIFSIAQPSSGSFEYKVQTGASMEYKVTDVMINGNDWMPVWLDGFSTQVNVTKDSKILIEVTNGTASEVKGYVSVTTGTKTTISSLLSLTNVWLGSGSNVYVSPPFVQQTTDKATWLQIANNGELQGNTYTTKWEWQQNNGFLSQEIGMNIISGFTEFFAFIFSVNESIEEIFSMTRSSPTVPGFEIPALVIPFIMLVVIIRIKTKKET